MRHPRTRKALTRSTTRQLYGEPRRRGGTLASRMGAKTNSFHLHLRHRHMRCKQHRQPQVSTGRRRRRTLARRRRWLRGLKRRLCLVMTTAVAGTPARLQPGHVQREADSLFVAGSQSVQIRRVATEAAALVLAVLMGRMQCWCLLLRHIWCSQRGRLIVNSEIDAEHKKMYASAEISFLRLTNPSSHEGMKSLGRFWLR